MDEDFSCQICLATIQSLREESDKYFIQFEAIELTCSKEFEASRKLVKGELAQMVGLLEKFMETVDSVSVDHLRTESVKSEVKGIRKEITQSVQKLLERVEKLHWELQNYNTLDHALKSPEGLPNFGGGSEKCGEGAVTGEGFDTLPPPPPPPVLQRQLSQSSQRALSTLSLLEESFAGLLGRARATEEAIHLPDSRLSAKAALMQLIPELERLQDKKEQVLTHDLESGKAEAKERRKELNRQIENLVGHLGAVLRQL